MNKKALLEQLQPELPQIGSHNVTLAPGVTEDGVTLMTEEIQGAIDTCHRHGGGCVTLEAGIYMTGPITLKSHVKLHLERGALLSFVKDYDAYPVIKTYYEGYETYRCQSPISAFDATDIAITGEGIIDGSGDFWRPVKQMKMTQLQWQELIASGGVVDEDNQIWWPTQKALDGQQHFLGQKGRIMDAILAYGYRSFLRPNMISLVNCSRVQLAQATFQNSPAWNIHPIFCQDVTVEGITVKNPWYSQNGDGIDVESSENVYIVNSTFDVGDDAICIKSGKDEEGRKRNRPTKNVRIEGCTVYHGHGGFVVGSEMSGGVSGILVKDCLFVGTDVGLRFKSCRGRGGKVEEIYVEGIRMTDIKREAIILTTFYEDFNSAHMNATPVRSEETPEFTTIFFEDIICTKAADGIVIWGLPELPIHDISFKNIHMVAEEAGLHENCEAITMESVTVSNL